MKEKIIIFILWVSWHIGKYPPFCWLTFESDVPFQPEANIKLKNCIK